MTVLRSRIRERRIKLGRRVAAFLLGLVLALAAVLWLLLYA